MINTQHLQQHHQSPYAYESHCTKNRGLRAHLKTKPNEEDDLAKVGGGSLSLFMVTQKDERLQ
jgi:hypothetical protein